MRCNDGLLARTETITIARVHRFRAKDDQGEYETEEWAAERPAEFADQTPLADFWRMVGYYRDVDDQQPCMVEIADADTKPPLVDLYERLTGRVVPAEVREAVDTHNLPGLKGQESRQIL